MSPGIAIVGAGAIGCRIAAHLAQRGVAATLFDGWPAHVQALNEHGLLLEHADGRRERLPARALPLDAPGPLPRFDLVLVAVRSDATESVLPLVARLLRDDGCVVSCQNGINEDAIAAVVGAGRTLGCSMVFGARLVAPGQVRVLPGPDLLRTGELRGGPSARLDRIVDLLSACGTSTATADLRAYRWMKLTLNATGNPLLLLTGLTAAGLHAREDARRVLIALSGEILGTAIALGVDPEPVLGMPARAWTAPQAATSTALHQALVAHGESLGARRLSMVADFEARGRTEVDHLNGHVVRSARSLGRPVPLNQAVWDAVKALESGRRQPGTGILDELARASITA